jgi:hypothetical protein
MSDSFRLTVPADKRFRALAPDVASRFVEVIGGSATDAAALAEALTSALDRLAAGADAGGGHIQFAFRSGSGAVEVDLSLDGRAQTITCPVAIKS